MYKDFDQFVIGELGPLALAGGTISIYEVAEKAYNAASLAASERVKEEAARVLASLGPDPVSFEAAASHIRAIDVQKLLDGE